VKPAPFEYYAPSTVAEALALLAEHGADAKPLAGGQSLIPAMNFRLAAPAVLIDLNGVDELAYVTSGNGDGGGLRIGAMTRHRTLERSREVAHAAPLVTQAMPFVAHPAIRTRGTLGGSLAHADPAAELPAVMVALDARFTARSASGTREIAAADFFTGLFGTALEPGELVTEIGIPAQPSRTATAFKEISRRHGDFALAGVAATVTVDGRQRCTAARVALFSVGDRPVLSERVPRVLTGNVASDAGIRAAASEVAAHDIDPPGDIHASSDYRRRLAEVLVRRALTEAFHSASASLETA
jgi:carbon-monoxide dehydrogenase medium subunit